MTDYTATRQYTAPYVAEIYDRWADYYDVDFRPEKWETPRLLVEGISKLFNVAGGSARILDIGIGTGLLSAEFKRVNPSCRITGLDLSQRMLACCREKKIADDIIQTDFQRDPLPIPSNSMDVVASSGVFELLNEPQKVIHEMARVLRPGGAFGFTVFSDTPHFYICNRHPDSVIEGALKESGLRMEGKDRYFAFTYGGISRIYYNHYTGRKPALA